MNPYLLSHTVLRREDLTLGSKGRGSFFIMKKSTYFKIGVIILMIYAIVLFHFLFTVVKVARDHHLSYTEVIEQPAYAGGPPSKRVVRL